MLREIVLYLVFGIVLILALIFDLGLLSKKNKKITIKQALLQTLFWVSLAMAFFVFMWTENGQKSALEYLSAYLMEWSLSIDNIFVFIIIFSSFRVKEQYYSRVLLAGILIAIVLRIIFITVGVVIVQEFEWVLLLFGAFLVFTGYKMFTATGNEEYDPHQSKVYLVLKKYLPILPDDGGGKYFVKKNGKHYYSSLFVVVVLLATIDLVFALDSIPAVIGISREKLVIYTSNIFAVLGLRSLFFLLRGAVSKFDYLQQGIAIVLIFIGLKMLSEHWLNNWIAQNTQVLISLSVILLCIACSILYSVFMKKKETTQNMHDDTSIQ